MPLRGTYRIRLLLRALHMALLRRRAERAVARFPRVKWRDPHGLGSPLVVNLTSYPPRFGNLAKTLRGLLDQTVRPDKTVLWLADGDAPALPADVLALCDHGLSIEYCADLKSFKKLIPALERWPEAYHVTADDDVYYPPRWLAGLVDAARRHPGAVIGGRVHLARLGEDGRMEPYARWELATNRLVAPGEDSRLFPTGVGGILYPPGSLDPTVDDTEAFLELCPRGDDIWFFWMARRAGTRHRRADAWFDIVEWPNSQDVALYAENLHNEGNDRQIRAMEERFGPVP